MFEKSDSSNRQKLMVASFSASARFTAKFELVFFLTQENPFFRVFILNPTERAQVLLKSDTRDF